MDALDVDEHQEPRSRADGAAESSRLAELDCSERAPRSQVRPPCEGGGVDERQAAVLANRENAEEAPGAAGKLGEEAPGPARPQH